MKKRERIWQVSLDIIFVLLCASTTLPFLLLLAVSFSNEKDIALHGYKIIPERFDISAYKFVFMNPDEIITAYGFTIFVTVIGTLLSVLLMAMIAYPLSIRTYKFRRFLSLFLFITMIFNGGMAASYIVNTQYYHLYNSVWIFILPGLISSWHVILLRTFFQGIPDEIKEAAKIDGASHVRIFFTMMIPLSKPALATVALMGTLTRWNDWMTSMMYTSKNEFQTVQYLLQEILLNLDKLQIMIQNGAGSMVNVKDIPSETSRMAMAIVAAGPIVIVFPFFQKYFTRGITVGSVKG